jgi:hypothetical protein
VSHRSPSPVGHGCFFGPGLAYIPDSGRRCPIVIGRFWKEVGNGYHADVGAGTPKEDRVRAQTKPEVNQQIDTELDRRIRFYATQDKTTISERF